jgi:hypothetical protein
MPWGRGESPTPSPLVRYLGLDGVGHGDNGAGALGPETRVGSRPFPHIKTRWTPFRHVRKGVLFDGRVGENGMGSRAVKPVVHAPACLSDGAAGAHRRERSSS